MPLDRHHLDELLRLGAFVLLVCLAATGYAKPQAPAIHIASNQANISQKTGQSTYTGDVELTRGRMTLHGDKLVVHRMNARGSIQAVLTGSPAHLEQQPEKPTDPPFTGHAQRIEYNNDSGQMTLSGNAEVDHGDDSITGPIITHNVNSGVTRAKGSSKSNGRVHITLGSKTQGKQDEQ